MASRTDTLKIVRADIVVMDSKIAEAQQGRVFGNSDPKITVKRVAEMMEHTALRLRKSFGLEGE